MLQFVYICVCAHMNMSSLEFVVNDYLVEESAKNEPRANFHKMITHKPFLGINR